MTTTGSLTTGTVRNVARDLEAAAGPAGIQHRFLLAPLTTFRVGGPAEWFAEVERETDLVALHGAAHRLGLDVTMLGGGSNVLVGEAGISGLVIRARHGMISQPDPTRVRAAAGVTLNRLIRWMVRRGLGGLEAWAGTPGTVGGAVHGNAHFRGRPISDRLLSVGVVGADGQPGVASVAEMGFGYDRSRLRSTGEAVRWADFAVTGGDAELLRAKARASLEFRKRTQPLREPSAGCVFKNPIDQRHRLPAGIPCSAGALIDGAGLKGQTCGGARVSDIHGNFLVTNPAATPRDVRTLIERCRAEVATRYDVVLEPEIVYLGEFGESS